MKHYIITRFLNDPSMNLGQNIFENQELIDFRLSLTKKYLIPSLNNQTDHNFELIFLIHDNLSKENIKNLETLEAKFNIIIKKNSELDSFTTIAYQNNDYFVTSRIDDDDMIYYNAVSDIHNLIDNNTILKIHGYRYGATLMDGETTPYFFDRDVDDGMIAIMYSLIINTRMVKSLKTIYCCGDHSYSRLYIENNYQNFGLSSVPVDFWQPNQTVSPAWIYVRHKHANSKGKEHFSDKIVDMDLFKMFGFRQNK